MLLVRRTRLALLATVRAGLTRTAATSAAAASEAPPSPSPPAAHAPRLTPTPQQRTADQAFLHWCASKQILAPHVEIGHCRLGGVAQRGLYATADFATGDPIVAVPHDAFVGRSTHHNKQLIALTDRIYPRGSPPLRPLTPDDLIKEDDPTLTKFAPNLQLAVLLTMEVALGAASPYRAWLDILPPLPADLLALSAPGDDAVQALSTAAAAPAVMNAPFLEPQSVQRLFRAAAAAGRTGLRGAELRAMIGDVSRRVTAYHEFLADTLSTHAVLRAMIERVAKARFGGDTDAAVSLFRWALSIVDSRANDSINNIEPDSPVMELDPYMHLDESGQGKETLDKTVAAQEARMAARDREMAGKPLSEQNRGDAKLRGAFGDLPEVLADAEAGGAGARLPDMTDLAISITPAVVPLIDVVNHADGAAIANASVHMGGSPPFSAIERRRLLRSLRQLGLSEARAEELNASDKKLSRFVMLRAARAIKKGEQLLLCYAPQIESCEDSFLISYGFVPQQLTEEHRLEQLRRLKDEADEREATQGFYLRLRGQRKRTEAEMAAADEAAPSGIFSHPDQVAGIPNTLPKAPSTSSSTSVSSSAPSSPSRSKAAVAPAAASAVPLGLDDDLLKQLGLDDLIGTPAPHAKQQPAAPTSQSARKLTPVEAAAAETAKLATAASADAGASPEDRALDAKIARIVQSSSAHRQREEREAAARKRDLERLAAAEEAESARSGAKWFDRELPSVHAVAAGAAFASNSASASASAPVAPTEADTAETHVVQDKWFERDLPRIL